MKNSMILFAVAVCFVAFTSSCEKESFAPTATNDDEIRLEQSNDDYLGTTDANGVNAIFSQGNGGRVAIKTYNNPDGQEKLLVYNPTQHNMFVYNSNEYTVEWKRNGEKIGNEIFLENVCDGSYSVTVSTEADGVVGTAKYRSYAECRIKDVNKIF